MKQIECDCDGNSFQTYDKLTDGWLYYRHQFNYFLASGNRGEHISFLGHNIRYNAGESLMAFHYKVWVNKES